jgi:predicted nucleic-acid-binding Zn-ribbon protein
MSEEVKCIRCGSTHFSTGWVQSTGKMYFRPDKTKFFSPRTSDLGVSGRMCMECGFLELVGDLEKAKVVVKCA